MERHLIRPRGSEAPQSLLWRAGRRYVVRSSPLGYRVLVHHPYGRVSRLPGADGGFELPDREAVAAALARALGVHEPGAPPPAGVLALLSGPGPRWELGEAALRTALARAA